jgi:hypothetical protein
MTLDHLKDFEFDGFNVSIDVDEDSTYEDEERDMEIGDFYISLDFDRDFPKKDRNYLIARAVDMVGYRGCSFEGSSRWALQMLAPDYLSALLVMEHLCGEYEPYDELSDIPEA